MTPLRFCMVTTFYPPYHFGGDAMYIYRLSHALAQRGHTVDVLHDRDAYHLARRGEPAQRFADHPGVRVTAMKSPLGALSPLLTQQTARPFLKPEVRRRLEGGAYDVIHFHNMSLIGSTALAFGRGVKLYTTHEHWLVCPMHVLWKFDREPCDAPQCLACTLHGRRPPQLWRYTDRLTRDLAHVNRLLSPSRFTRQRHVDAGIDRPITVLPYFVPEQVQGDAHPSRERPYFLYVGRLVKLKGVDTLIRALAYVGIAAEPCVVDLAPPAGMHPAIARDLTPLSDVPPALDLVDVRRLTLGLATEEALARRWRRVRGPSRPQRERCRALLRGQDVAFAWRRRAWTTRAAFRAPVSRRVLRPVVFDRDAFASLGDEGRVLASDGLLGRWLF